jgi:hypothetical protein
MADTVEILRTETESDQLTICPRTRGRLQNTGERLGLAVAQAQAFASKLRYRAEQAQRTKPFQFLTVIAGVALATGIAARVWRSSTNA